MGGKKSENWRTRVYLGPFRNLPEEDGSPILQWKPNKIKELWNEMDKRLSEPLRPFRQRGITYFDFNLKNPLVWEMPFM